MDGDIGALYLCGWIIGVSSIMLMIRSEIRYRKNIPKYAVVAQTDDRIIEWLSAIVQLSPINRQRDESEKLRAIVHITRAK
jgi:hypothetical protein